jgi:hypothetical protein
MIINFPAPGSETATQLNTVFENFTVPSNSGALSYIDTTDIEIGTPIYITNYKVSFNVADWYAKELNILSRSVTVPSGSQTLNFNNKSASSLILQVGYKIKITDLVLNTSTIVTISAATISGITIPVIPGFPLYGNRSIRIVNVTTEIYPKTAVSQKNVSLGLIIANIIAPRDNLFLSETAPSVRGIKLPISQSLISSQIPVVPSRLNTYSNVNIKGDILVNITDQSTNLKTTSSNIINWYATEEPILKITTTLPSTKILYFSQQSYIPFFKGSTVRVSATHGFIGTFTVLDCSLTSVTLDNCAIFGTVGTTVDNITTTVRKVRDQVELPALPLRNLLYSLVKSTSSFIGSTPVVTQFEPAVINQSLSVREVSPIIVSAKLSTYDNVGLTEGAAVTINSIVENILPITGMLSNASSNVVNWYTNELNILTTTYTNPSTVTLFFNKPTTIGSDIVLSNSQRSYISKITVISSTLNSVTIARPAFDINFTGFFTGFFIYVSSTLNFTSTSSILYNSGGFVKLNAPGYSTVVPIISGNNSSITVEVPLQSLTMSYTSFENASLSVYPSVMASSMSHTREKIFLVSSRIADTSNAASLDRIASADIVPKIKSVNLIEPFYNVPNFVENVIVSTGSVDTVIPITFSIQAYTNNVVQWYEQDLNILKQTAITQTTLILYFNNSIGVVAGSTIRVIEYTSKLYRLLTVISANSYSATVAYDSSLIINNLYVYVKTTQSFTQKSFIPYIITGIVSLKLPNSTIVINTSIINSTSSSIEFVKTSVINTAGATISDANPSYYPQIKVATTQLPLTPRENLYYAVVLPYYRTAQTVKPATEEPRTFSNFGKISAFKTDQYQGFIVPKNDKVQTVKFTASATSVSVGDVTSLPKFSTVPTAITASAVGQTVYNVPTWYGFELNILQRQSTVSSTTRLVFNNASSYNYLFSVGDTVKLYRLNYYVYVEILSATLTTITFITPNGFPNDTSGLTIQNYSSTIYPKDVTYAEMAPLGMPRDVQIPRQNLISAEYIKPNQRGSTDFNIDRTESAVITSGLLGKFKVDIIAVEPINKANTLNKPLFTVVNIAAKINVGKVTQFAKIAGDAVSVSNSKGVIIKNDKLTSIDQIISSEGIIKQFKVDRIAGITSEPAKIIVTPLSPIQFWN